MRQTLVPFIMSLLLVASCSRKHDFSQKVLNIVVPQKVKGFDPIFASDKYSGNEVSRVYEGLLEYHYLKRPYVLTPNLAAEMPSVSSDGLTYTFKLRQDIFFHDDPAFEGGKGRQAKAQDVVYSIKRVADPKLQSTGWWVLEGKLKGLDEWRKKYASAASVNYADEVEGVKFLDDFTVQFKLNQPFPQFLYALAMPFNYVAAKEAVEKYGAEFLNHPVGTGPFMIKDGVFTQGNTIEYVKNPKFRTKLYPSEGEAGDQEAGFLADAGKQLPLVDKLVIQIIEEDQPRWLNFQKGRLDYLAIPKDNFDQAVTPDKKGLSKELNEKGIILHISPLLDITYTAFNHHDPIFKNNLKLRQAMSLAHDTEETNKLFYNSTAIPAQSIIPPGIAGHDATYVNPLHKLDLEKAKQLLKEAGYPEGKGLPELNFETVATTVSRQMAEHFAKSMAKIGINVKVNSNTWPELVKKVNTKQAQLFGMAWGADYPDAENFLQLIYGPNKAPGSNGSNFDHPEFNKIFEKARLLQDSPERTALYEKLNKLASELSPWIFGVHRTEFALRHGWLRNYKPTEFDHGVTQYFNIDLEAKKKLVEKL